jgi:hypothetical protein
LVSGCTSIVVDVGDSDASLEDDRLRTFLAETIEMLAESTTFDIIMRALNIVGKMK